MSVEDHGLEVLKKSGELVNSNDKSDMVIKTISGNKSTDALAYDATTTVNTIYIGYAPIGSITSDAVWLVFKIDTSTGLQTFADSNSDYDNVWDDRASLTYG